MLLQLLFITFVVCTAEISEFHAFFLCFFAHFGNFSLVSFGACDKFSIPSVVVSLSMSQTSGSCGHLKGSYDNHKYAAKRDSGNSLVPGELHAGATTQEA